MKNKTGKEDRFISEIIKDFRMESPSPGFTDRVMQNIQAQSDPSVCEVRPLIGRTGWIGIAVGFCIILGIIVFGYDSDVPSESGSLFDRIPFIDALSIEFSFQDLFSWINFENSTLYWIFTGIGGILLLGLLQRIINSIGSRHFFIL
jgi:hypothetical protein